MFGALIPVGPGKQNVSRLVDTLESLAAHEDRTAIYLVLVDDDSASRSLPTSGWPNVVVVRTPLWSGERPPDLKSALVAGVMAGMREMSRVKLEFCVKLDTDALVIAPFAEQIRRAFNQDPNLGIVGSYDLTCIGTRRDWTHKGQVMLHAPGRWHVHRRATRLHIPIGVWYKRRDRRAAARNLLSRALANGYEPGAHCLGGAYAVSARMLAHDELFDWRPWVRTWDLGEDVAMGLLCHVAGMGMRSLVGEHEPFALAFQGLPASPEWIVGRHHSLVHSVKDHGDQREDELRAWFREHTR